MTPGGGFLSGLYINYYRVFNSQIFQGNGLDYKSFDAGQYFDCSYVGAVFVCDCGGHLFGQAPIWRGVARGHVRAVRGYRHGPFWLCGG